MGFMSGIKANKALRLQKNGEFKAAEKLYEEAFAEGVNDPRYFLPYALMLIRDGQYQKAREFLVAHQKAPGMSPGQRVELLVYYATCCLRLGHVDKGINTLEQQYKDNVHNPGERRHINQRLRKLHKQAQKTTDKMEKLIKKIRY